MYIKQIHTIDLYAGERLLEARTELGLTRDELVEKLEHPVTFQQLQKYESGRNRLSASRIWEFAQVLSMPPEYFFPPFDESTRCRSIAESSLLETFRVLPTDKKSALLAFLKTER